MVTVTHVIDACNQMTALCREADKLKHALEESEKHVFGLRAVISEEETALTKQVKTLSEQLGRFRKVLVEKETELRIQKPVVEAVLAELDSKGWAIPPSILDAGNNYRKVKEMEDMLADMQRVSCSALEDLWNSPEEEQEWKELKHNDN